MSAILHTRGYARENIQVFYLYNLKNLKYVLIFTSMKTEQNVNMLVRSNKWSENKENNADGFKAMKSRKSMI